MKNIQILVEDNLLERIDKLSGQWKSRSGFFREAARAYLLIIKNAEIRMAYQKGYSNGNPVKKEFALW